MDVLVVVACQESQAFREVPDLREQQDLQERPDLKEPRDLKVTLVKKETKALEARLVANGKQDKPRKSLTIPVGELNNLLQDLKTLREAITFAGATVSK